MVIDQFLERVGSRISRVFSTLTLLQVVVLALSLGTAGAALAQADEVARPTSESANLSGAIDILREAPDLLQKGVWRHRVDLDLPPSGFLAKPELSLVGSHLGGEMAGTSWSLSGFSSIERRGPNGGAPTRTALDTFYYGGIQLIETGDISDRPRVFRLEKDGNQVFRYFHNADSWAMSRDGWTYRYGDINGRDQSNASERFRVAFKREEICHQGLVMTDLPIDAPVIVGGGKVMKWHLRRIKDPAGNAVNYTYSGECDCGPIGKLALACPHWPKKITYGTAEISFDFEDRHDTRIAARDGVPRYFNKRLSRITSRVNKKAGTTVFSNYELSYLPDQPRSLLSTVERVGVNGERLTLAEADYDLSPTSFVPGSSIPAIEAILAEYPTQDVVPYLVNFDGNGFPDLVLIDERIDGSRNTYGLIRGYRNNGQSDFSFIFDPEMTDMLTNALGPTAENGFEQPRREPASFNFADVDGDGRTELHGSGIWEYEPGQGYLETGWTDSFVSSDYILVDIDGDGLEDKVEPGYLPTWIRNQGQDPFFPPSERQDIILPVERDDTFALEIESLMEQCGSGPFTGWVSTYYYENTQGLRYLGMPSYEYPWDYWAGQVNYADVTGDGIADMIYAINNCPHFNNSARGPETYAWSRVFIGRGDGTFIYTDIDAGPPFLQFDSPADVGNPDPSLDLSYYGDRHEYTLGWRNWSPVDFDGDGVVEIIHRPDGHERLYSAHFANATDGFTFGPDHPAALALPAAIKTLNTYSRTGFKPYQCGCFFHQITLPADWDGDGFTDIFVLERDAVTDGQSLRDGRSPRNYRTRLYRNTRDAPHYALKGVRTQTGGRIALNYEGSARNGMNPDLPTSMMLVASVTDDRGTSRFNYSGGRIEAGEFLGFAEIEGTHANGLSFEAEYSLSPAFRGELVSRTERRKDGTIERLNVYERLRLAGSIYTFDTVAPFFNPIRRACQFEVSHYEGAGPGLPPDPTQDALLKAELKHACATFERPGLSWLPLPQITQFESLSHGWDPRAAVGQKRAELVSVNGLREIMGQLPDRPLNRGPLREVDGGPDAGDGKRPEWQLGRVDSATKLQLREQRSGERTRVAQPLSAGTTRASTSNWSGLQTELGGLAKLYGNLTLPALQLPLLSGPVTATPEHRMFVKDFSYNADQRVSEIRDHNLSTEPDDTVTTQFGYDAYVGGFVQGPKLLSWSRTYPGGSYSTTYSDHFAFGLPRRITETGTDGTTRARTLGYDRQGRMTASAQQADASGRMLSEIFAYGECGLRTKITDAAGRVLEQRYDGTCRLEGSRFEGGIKSMERDGFGRVVSSVADAGEAPAKKTLTFFNDAFRNPLLEVDRATLVGREATGTFLDQWGRPVLTMRCALQEDLDETTIAKATEIKCQDGSEIYTLRGWARDGSQRVSTGSFARGEVPFVGFTFYDERRRLVRKVEPNHAFIERPRRDQLAGFPVGGTFGWVETAYEFGLGYTRTEAPGGHSCTEEFTTLSRTVTCAGQAMAAYKLDAEGRILASTDEMGISTDFEYDGFFNLSRETTGTTLETCTGSHLNPSVAYLHDLAGRLVKKSMANGAEMKWSYDEIGRLTSARFYESAGARAISGGDWAYVDAGKGARTIVETDVNGNEVRRYFDGFGRPTRTELPDGTYTETERDAFGRPVSVRDVDGIIQYFDYDTLGRLVHDYHLVDASDAESCLSPAGAGQCRVGIAYEYDGAGRITATTDADGVRERHGYTAQGDLAFSARGPWIMQAARYNDDGTPEWIWTEGAYTSFSYDAWMRPEKICEGAELGTGNCARIVTLERDASGRITSSTLNGMARTTMSYDDVGRLVAVSRPEGGVQRYTYGVATPMCEASDEEGLKTRWTYDGLGRLASFQAPEFERPRAFSYRYGVSIPGSSRKGSQTEISEPDGGTWLTQYDFADRPIRQRRPDGTVLAYDYGGAQLQKVELLDAAGATVERVRMGYDSLGRLAYEAGPSLDDGPYAPGQYGLTTRYTDAGRPLERAGPSAAPGSPAAFATRNVYGQHGLLVREDQVGITQTRYAYDLAHRYPRLKSTAVGPKGQERETVYTYAPGGLDVRSIAHTGMMSGTVDEQKQSIVLTFEDHDAYGQPRAVTRIQEAYGQSIPDFQAKFVTDRNGRLVAASSEVASGRSRSVSYKYRDNNEIVAWFIAGEGGQELIYDSRGRLERASVVDGQGRATQMAYHHTRFDAVGRPIRTQLGDGGTVGYVHDQLGRLTAQKITLGSGAVRNLTTVFDARGLPEQETVSINGERKTTEYSYTPEGWLSAEAVRDGAGQVLDDVSYTYDVAGNRTAMLRPGLPDTEYSYGSVEPGESIGDALLSVTTGGTEMVLGWDKYGGMIEDQRGFGIVRDVTGRAQEVWDPNGYRAAEFTRDHLHRASKIDTNDAQSEHLWGNPLSDVYPLITTGAERSMSFVALDQSLFGISDNGRFETAMTDRGGTLVNDGDAFIDLTRAFGQGVQKPGSGVPFVFAGQEIIEGLPFLNAQQRLYDPETGLFASTDPLGELGSRHRFRYASNAPTIRLDPLGTEDYAEHEGMAEGAEVDFDGESAEAVTVDISQTGGEELGERWQTGPESVTDPDGMTYPVHETQTDVMMETSDGGFVNMTVFFFFDGHGNEQWIAEFTGSGPVDVETGDDGDLPGADVGPDTEIIVDTDPSTDEMTLDINDEQDGDTGGDYSEPPPNFNGSAAEWAGLESDGYSVGDDGYGYTPSGMLVIPGMNDALNPSPLKVLVNLGADTVDDALNNAPGMWMGQQLGLIDGNFSPANGAIKSAGFGYTPSEKPREAIAETSVSIMMSAVSAPVSGAAAARGQAIVARGCAGPLGSAPKTLRILMNVNCFAPETPVLTRQGYQRIDEIEAGEDVACGFGDGDSPVFCPVDAVMITPNRAFAVLRVRGADGVEDELKVTRNHRFYTGNDTWTEVQALDAGDEIFTAGGTPATVLEVDLTAGGGGSAYNLEVGGAHTYYVGATQLFTHNGGPGGVCPVTKIKNHKQLGKLLGRPGVKNSKQVTVGEIKDLYAQGKISKTAMNTYLRGKSSSQRKFLLKEGKSNGGMVTARAGDWFGLIPASEAKNGKNWHVGHVGSSLRDQIKDADNSLSVNAFRKGHWSGTMFEAANDNVGRGAGTTQVDQMLRTIDVGDY